MSSTHFDRFHARFASLDISNPRKPLTVCEAQERSCLDLLRTAWSKILYQQTLALRDFLYPEILERLNREAVPGTPWARKPKEP